MINFPALRWFWLAHKDARKACRHAADGRAADADFFRRLGQSSIACAEAWLGAPARLVEQIRADRGAA